VESLGKGKMENKNEVIFREKVHNGYKHKK